MGRFFSFRCRDCGVEFSLKEGGDGWIDEHGHFGYALHPILEPIGKPEGKFQYITFDICICLDCGQMYHLINGSSNFAINPSLQIIDHKEIWLIQEPELEEYRNPESNLIYNIPRDPCVNCQGKIVGALDFLHHVPNRQRLKKFDIPPPKPDDLMYQCFACKGLFEYKNFMQS